MLGTDDSTTLEQDLLNLFNQIDTDNSDTLDLNEVVLFFKAITDDISLNNIQRIFYQLDKDGNKVLDFEEFKVRKEFYEKFAFQIVYLQKLFHRITVAGWRRKGAMNREEIKELEIEYCFNLIDTSNTNNISLEVKKNLSINLV